jgi:glycosyltransferase involved in cell wall biosynthesis
MSERITWLMPVRNAMPFLRETLASIAAQTYTKSEILVWDVESDDGTLEELRRWIPSRIPGTIFCGRSQSVGKISAFLVEQARTELCARIDADDINEPTRLEKQVAHMRAHPEVVALGTQVRLIDAQGDPLPGKWDCPLDDAEVRWRTRWQSGLVHPAVMFRKDAVLRAGNYGNIVGIEDCELWIRLCPFGEITNLPDVLLSYRRHSSSVSAGYTDYFEGQLRSARHAAQHLFPGFDAEQALAFWRLTHPRDIDQDAPVSVRQIYQLSVAAKLLARQCGKPDNYFKNSRTYRAQLYWLQRRLLRRSGVLTIAKARRSRRIRLAQLSTPAQNRA